ncbi:MAG: flagellar M-ring protein FliF [Bacillaceae bacterium]|nr:flagellar M-ring protein FliF [Bacillaceae bacterium]
MNERLQQLREKATEYWNRFTTRQKVMIGASLLFLLAAIILFILYASRPEYINLYSNNLSQQEIGEIKEALDNRGYDYKLAPGGTNIMVPRKDAASITVELAAQGIPKNGSISYEVFSQNMGFGTSDRQLDVIERDAMQNELRNLLTRIDGVQNAEVMITLPEESVFITPGETQQSTASVIVQVEPGKRLDNSQIRALYYLVSRSVPDLPLENIVIMNQFSEMLTLEDEGNSGSSSMAIDEQLEIQRQLQREIENGLKNMLGTILGRDKVLVHTYLKLNFDKESRVENLVEPVDPENNEGIAISIEKIQESFQGTGEAPGGVAGVGDQDVPGYPGNTSGGESEYEKTIERVNNEVNRIQREVTESPYEIQDITINVGVDLPDGDPAIPHVEEIIKNVVRTTLASQGTALTDQDIENRITVFPRTFEGKPTFEPENRINPTLLIGLIALTLASTGAMIYTLIRRRRKSQEEEEIIEPVKVDEIPEEDESEEAQIRRQLENLAKNKPEEFATLMRSWLLDD